ncbi:putative MFS-type transporter [Colletotrichum gloeosporioides]|uniref:Putative MFS-type transporter n=1 Tax=Colletotrichum gloeosporioides TaxID=474922 RepID=A0A8H4CRM5_COLGL|nr:putative MFS-type transporter [Colletotrichum gloeosporioides]KAF3808856.1 putative MFS-type transporter [Colletotrichum gloeosporioides]
MSKLQDHKTTHDHPIKVMKDDGQVTEALRREGGDGHVATPAVPASGRAILVDPRGLPLVPQPNSDPLDPLNWSKSEKALILFIVCYAGFLSIYLTTAPVASFPLLQEHFNISYSEVNWSLGVPALGLAIGILLFAGFSDVWGRRPVLLGTTLIALVATGCTTTANLPYGAYLVLRLLQGIGAGPALNVGFAIVQDVTYEHERGFKTGLWILSIDVGGMIGAFREFCLEFNGVVDLILSIVGGFVADAGILWVQYHVAIAYGVLLLLEAFLLPETFYPRDLISDSVMLGRELESVKRTKSLRFWKVQQLQVGSRRRTFMTAIRFMKLLTQPRLMCAIIPYIFFQYWWVVSILTMGPVAYAQYSTQTQGLLWLGLISGTITIEIVCSGRMLDNIASRLAKSNNDIMTPAMYLWLAYPATLLGAGGCILWGLSIDRHWHFMVDELALFIFAAGLQMGNVTVVTYAITAFPDSVLEVISLYGVLYNVSAFLVPWFINDWVEALGFTWSFATQGLITLLVIPSVMILQM